MDSVIVTWLCAWQVWSKWNKNVRNMARGPLTSFNYSADQGTNVSNKQSKYLICIWQICLKVSCFFYILTSRASVASPGFGERGPQNSVCHFAAFFLLSKEHRIWKKGALKLCSPFCGIFSFLWRRVSSSV